MRKFILAPLALACMLVAAQAQQQQTFTADQGKPGAAPWPVTWTGQSVLADLRVAGSPVAAGNPVPVSVGNFPASQAVTNAGTFAVQNTAAVVGGNAVAVKTDGSATTQPVSGTVATSNGALDATVTARFGTLGQKAMAGSAPVTIASDQPSIATKIDQTTPGSTNGVVVNNRTLWYAPTLMTAGVAANATTFSNERDQGATAPSPYSFYRVLVNCNQTGTISILAKTTPGSSTIAVAATAAVSANVPTTIQVPALFRIFQAQYVNGATAATNCTVVDGFTAN